MKSFQLKLANVHLSIAKKIICNGLNITFHSGEVWGILGPNGAGKTTFLHALASLLPLDEGKIFLNNDNLNHLSPRTIAKHIGLLFQTNHDPFPQTVWEYCLSSRFPHLSPFQKETLLDKQIVSSALEKMELKTLLTRSITALSGGERKRLAIAALLAQTPQIYLLDEPTNDLDIRHQFIVMEHFKILAKNQSATILMALHDINLAQQFCENILLLFANGHVLYGTKDTILTHDHLSSLYQHPIMRIAHADHHFWHLHPHTT